MGRIDNREAVRRLEREARLRCDLHLLHDAEAVLGLGRGAARLEYERETARRRLAASWPDAASWDSPLGQAVDAWLSLDSGLGSPLPEGAGQMTFAGMPRPAARRGAEVLLHPASCTSPDRIRLVEERTGLAATADADGRKVLLVDPLRRDTAARRHET